MPDDDLARPVNAVTRAVQRWMRRGRAANFTYAERGTIARRRIVRKDSRGNAATALDLVGFTYSYLRYLARRISTSPPLRGRLNICLACPATNYGAAGTSEICRGGIVSD